MSLSYYKEVLGEIPEFLYKYLESPSLKRLKKIGYFCGMDYASKDIYQFSELISRYDHSLTVALMIYKLTKNKKATIAGLFHDISTPCFAHVIDYMNEDYEKQESTEKYTEKIIRNDPYLLRCLEDDQINVEEIIDFKRYSVVDNKRPKLCVDRLDGIILTALGWSKDITKEEISQIIKDVEIYKDEQNEDEIGFKSLKPAEEVVKKSERIDELCHTNEDNFMMDLLSKITKLGIKYKLFSYEELYILSEEEILMRLKSTNEKEIKDLLEVFFNCRKEEVQEIKLPYVKRRNINPMVQGKRLN